MSLRLNIDAWRDWLARALGPRKRAAWNTGVRGWTKELAGNELVRALPRFDSTGNTYGGPSRICFLPDGRYSLLNHDWRDRRAARRLLPKSRRPRGKWAVTPGGQGEPMLQVCELSGGGKRLYTLRFNPQDPEAVYLDGKRYLRRFVRGHLRAAS